MERKWTAHEIASAPLALALVLVLTFWPSVARALRLGSVIALMAFAGALLFL